VQSYIAPPITAVFLLGIFWKRINAKGAISTLIGGFAIGMLRLVAELNKEHLDGVLYQFADLNFLYFCFFLFVACIGAMVVISFLTQVPSYDKIQGLTYGTTVSEDKKTSRESWNKRDVLMSAVVLIIIALVMIYFSPLIIAK
jgi:SSS family solute:Na+ symporter